MTRSLREHPSASEFLREFQDTHLSELSFLLAQRRRFLHEPRVGWPDIEALEVRILRHAEAMCVGGEVAFACAKEALASDDPDELTAGAYALAFTEDGIREVLRGMAEADGPLLPCFIEALLLVPHPHLSKQLPGLLSSSRPEVRSSTARILGHRKDAQAAGALLPLLDDASAEVRSATALALAELGHLPALPLIEQRLKQVGAVELDGWLLAALRLGSSRALPACRQAARTVSPLSPRIPWLLGLSGDATDLGLMRQLCLHPGLLCSALDALGILGVPAAVPLLLEHLEHQERGVKEAAARALELMTGAGLTEVLRVLDDEDMADEEGSWHEVRQPTTQATTWRAWWAQHHARLEGLTRLRRGRPYSLDSCIEELAHPSCAFDVRARAGLEMDIRSGEVVGFQPDWPIRRQLQAIAHWKRR
ncbi:MAG: hypothetical protein EOO71_03080 [Myxococcaceae bacterium]|nr:MAG: hypothetical protein EOO71_03080 [Myxococcaceae bacterium]